MAYLSTFEVQPCPLLQAERRRYPATTIRCAALGRPIAELDAALEAFGKEAV